MIVLFTDFGPAGPYVGQVKAVLLAARPDIPVIELLSDAPAFDARACSYLLAALAPDFPAGAVFLAIVDPGVGGDRAPVVVKAGGQWFVGPDNGLFEIVSRRSPDLAVWQITFKPERLSASFHGRDLFAPVASIIAAGGAVPGDPMTPDLIRGADWPDDLPKIIYIDHFGNAITGLRAVSLPENAILDAGGHQFSRARVFSDVASDAVFWYENANGLAEIAVNRGRADRFGLTVGTSVVVSTATHAGS